MDLLGLEELYCTKCPGGEWEGSSFLGVGLSWGGSVTIDRILWNCLSSGATCEETYFCFGGGAIAEASLDLVGTASAKGAYESKDLAGWSSGHREVTPVGTVSSTTGLYNDVEVNHISSGVPIGIGITVKMTCVSISGTCDIF